MWYRHRAEPPGQTEKVLLSGMPIQVEQHTPKTAELEDRAVNCPQPYKVLWKVKNVGPEAERRNEIRGQIAERGRAIVEHTSFFGNHYIECYIVKDGMCVAKNRIEIPIGRGGVIL